MLADMASEQQRYINDQLSPPSAPFASQTGTLRSVSPKTDTPLIGRRMSGTSLSVNYLPSKFSSNAQTKRRKGWKDVDYMLPKQGGGREAFRSNESRMPGDGDDDYDGVSFHRRQGGRTRPKLRWNRFKWMLFAANFFFTLYSLAGLIVTLLIWFNVWNHADIVRVGNRTELIVSTTAAALGVLTSLIGWSGILLNNRSFLAIYSFLLWICFALLVTPGYITYKKRTFNLDGKVNAQWSRDLGADGRLRIQNQLNCCGFFNPFVEATASQTCFARSTLPGCKAPYKQFEEHVLEKWYTVIFSLVPAQLYVMVTGLLCSNHITYRFGKGMMPKAYRLNMNSMAVIMDNYANQLAEQYGNDVASEVLARSRSNLQLDVMPTMPYQRGGAADSTYSSSKYDTLPGRTPEAQ